MPAPNHNILAFVESTHRMRLKPVFLNLVNLRSRLAVHLSLHNNLSQRLSGLRNTQNELMIQDVDRGRKEFGGFSISTGR